MMTAAATPTTTQCQQCRRELPRGRVQRLRRYCNDACRQLASRQRRGQTCKRCGGEFFASSQRTYCSRACWGAERHEQANTAPRRNPTPAEIAQRAAEVRDGWDDPANGKGRHSACGFVDDARDQLGAVLLLTFDALADVQDHADAGDTDAAGLHAERLGKLVPLLAERLCDVVEGRPPPPPPPPSPAAAMGRAATPVRLAGGPYPIVD